MRNHRGVRCHPESAAGGRRVSAAVWGASKALEILRYAQNDGVVTLSKVKGLGGGRGVIKDMEILRLRLRMTTLSP